jgi:hypothetical protein
MYCRGNQKTKIASRTISNKGFADIRSKESGRAGNFRASSEPGQDGRKTVRKLIWRLYG